MMILEISNVFSLAGCTNERMPLESDGCLIFLIVFSLHGCSLQTACRSHFIVLKSCSFCVDFTVTHHNISNATASSFLPYDSSHIYPIFPIVLRANCPTFCCTTTAFSRSSGRYTR